MNEESENGDLAEKENKSNGTKFNYAEIEKMLPDQFDDLYKTLPLTEETTCGIWFIRGRLWQK